MSHRWYRYLRYAHRAAQLLQAEGIVALLQKGRRRLGTTAFRIRRRTITLLPEISDKRPNFDRVEAPKAAIIIPVHNAWNITLQCLLALKQNTTPQNFEVIVVDDGSTDRTPALLAECGGVHVVRLDSNQGFVKACNAGAALARAGYLVFLNNDTQVQPGWLQHLLDTFEVHPKAGLAGSRLVYPSGRQQEAGGIIFNDGSAWNFGHLDDPSKPQYSYARQPDYVSGAALAIRRRTFLDVGGFDINFAPAYYEDVDLAFRVRRLGKEVWYQPLSWVVHLEGATAGLDTSSEGLIKRYQAINQRRFVDRWSDEISELGCREEPLEFQKERNVQHHVFVVDTYMVRPDRDSGSVRLRNIFRLFLEHQAKVTFAASNLEAPEPYTSELQSSGVEVLYRPFVRSIVTHLKQSGSTYDLVMLSRADNASSLIAAARAHCPNARIIFDTVDLHYLRDERFAQLAKTRSALRLARVRKAQELDLVKQAHTTLVVSPVERDLIQSEVPSADIRELSNVHDVAGCRKGFNERAGIMFIGAFEHTPNSDAVIWFCDSILPAILKCLPSIEFRIIGANPPPAVRALAGKQVEVLGHVRDVGSYFDDARLSVAPLRYGAGVKGKINQSLAYGLPVVATSLAAEGMPVLSGHSILLADDPATFATQVVKAYTDPTIWRTLSKAGLQVAAEHFSLDSARVTVGELFAPEPLPRHRSPIPITPSPPLTSASIGNASGQRKPKGNHDHRE